MADSRILLYAHSIEDALYQGTFGMEGRLCRVSHRNSNHTISLSGKQKVGLEHKITFSVEASD